MSLSPAEEALVRDLIAQNAALLSLASSESTIISKLGATKTTLSALTAASSLADSDLMLVRQGVTDKSVTGAILKAFAVSPAASETVAGILEIATAAEAQAFTANKAIDGAKLASAFQGANQSLASNGYQKMPGGLIIQWGISAVQSSESTVNVTYPFTFPTSVFQVVCGTYVNGGTADRMMQLSSFSTSGATFLFNSFDSTAGSGQATYIAIGY